MPIRIGACLYGNHGGRSRVSIMSKGPSKGNQLAYNAAGGTPDLGLAGMAVRAERVSTGRTLPPLIGYHAAARQVHVNSPTLDQGNDIY